MESVNRPDKAQPEFMELWRLYTHCRTSDDALSVVRDAVELSQAAETAPTRLPALLKPMEQYVTPAPNRLAADPRAMAAACTLVAGDAAARMGWNDLAMALYRDLLTRASENEYSYYAAEARNRLKGLVGEELEAVRESPASMINYGDAACRSCRR
jgi:hypothetical protein